VFCQSAIESAQQDHAAVVQSTLENKEALDDKWWDSWDGPAAGWNYVTMFGKTSGYSKPTGIQQFEKSPIL